MSRLEPAEKLIEAIKNRPCLWDTEYPGYQQRQKRIQAWKEITHMFNKRENATEQEMKLLEKKLLKKWSNFRYNLNKEVKRRKSLLEPEKYPGSMESKKLPYVYFKHLQFMLKNRKDDKIYMESDIDASNETTSKGTLNTIHRLKIDKQAERKEGDSDSDSGSGYIVSIEDPIHSPSPPKTNIRQDSVPPRGFEFLNTSEASTSATHEDDAEKLFLLSLVKPLKRVPEHMRLGVQVEIIQAIERATKINSYN